MKRKTQQYFLIAFLIHVVIIGTLAPFKLVPPYVKEVLFKARLAEKRETKTTVQRMEPQLKRIESAEIPVHILKKKPVVKKDLNLKKKPKIPPRKIPEVAVPKAVELSRKHKMKSETIISEERLKRQQTYKQFAKKFKVSGRGRAIKAVFTPVLARYKGGDYNKDPKAIPNLMLEINRRSNVRASTEPKVVSVSSQEIFDCPFVYFTGTRDFKFTDEEAETLRKYLLQGGMVWADNGLPGRRSGFDIAFRREMKRVLPDRDFETISTTHEVFSSFYKLDKVPGAMNYRNDPPEIITIDKRVVLIYTLNDYGDFWETRLKEDGEVDDSLDENWVSNLGPHWGKWELENLNKETIEDAYRLGINIVAYLLTR